MANTQTQDRKCLASLVVFRELYNSEKDIYGIICEFLKELIVSKPLYQFSLTEISILLNETYDFKIPEAVINSSLRRFTFLEKSQGVYTVNNTLDLKHAGNITDKHKAITQSNELIIDNLFEYIKNEKNEELSEKQKEIIVHSFCSFIIDESALQEYSEYVSAYILKNKQDANFTSQLNTIKEGVVLYSGIKYHSNLNDVGSWITELTIYIETEILFHFAGYNGILYKSLFDDFLSFVKEINLKNQRKESKKLIHLKYFPEVKSEIERYFKKAEYIVSGQDKVNPSKTAMTSIVNGCKSPAEIVEKKALFYQLLQNNSITEDDYSDYYFESNYKYNIEDRSIIEQISSKTGIEDVTTYLKFLNYINIHRKGISNKSFENIGFILLSGTSNTLQVAWDELIKVDRNIPLATTLNFLTNKFWFKLNRGFGKNDYPKTFDVITKAQIVLSTQLNESVAEKYDEFILKLKNGELTESQAIAIIAELRRQSRKPEEINEFDVKDVLESIEESSIEQYMQEQELLRNHLSKQDIENTKLKKELLEKEEELRNKEFEHSERIKNEKKLNLQKEQELELYREKERKIELKRAARKSNIRKIKYFIGLLLFISLGVILYIYLNQLVGILTGTIAGLFTILAFFKIDISTVKNFWNKK